MPTAEGAANPSGAGRLARAAKVIIVSSVMFTFISYWRTAAVVLCDLASTAYYIGAIVEQAIGAAAPWFILAVMLFSYAVRSVYLESCSLFVRGGVYRVVKEAMGGFLAKLSVSALMFDYVLTGPISGVTASQYLIGLVLDSAAYFFPGWTLSKVEHDHIMNWGSVVLTCLITLYFFRQNLLGIHESSDKALKIMIATTVMAAVVLTWSGYTLATRGAANTVPLRPDLRPHPDYVTLQDNGQPRQSDPLGFITNTPVGERLRKVSEPSTNTWSWFSLIGVMGIFIAFGHSILAMSGEETLAQVYREVESPKMPNFKKAAFIVFVYSLMLTAGISFLAVLLVPDAERMPKYNQNLISGLAMHMAGPEGARLLLNAFVVIVGFLILSGAVNTAIIGSNGVLNRVAEDGVMPDWFLKPHRRYGTTYRILYLILILQLTTIIYSGGDTIALGEAYAFGVVWSFVFKALAMVVLRFRDKSPREFKVPLNIHIRGVEIPIGLVLIFLILLIAAIMNLLTKKTATYWGGSFTAAFLTVFLVTEYYHERRRRGQHHAHLEQFNQQEAEAITPQSLGLNKPYRKLVAIRSPQNLQMLEKALGDTDPATTDVVVMTAKVSPAGDVMRPDLDHYDQQLMTAVVQRAEKAGKQVKPLIVPTNNPLYAVVRAAKDLQAQELIVGASNKYTPDEFLDQVAFYWFNLHDGQPGPLTVRLLGKERDVHLDLAGGSRIPKLGERRARTVADLRQAGVGVDHVLMVHDHSPESSDLFQDLLTMLDPKVNLGVVSLPPQGQTPVNGGLKHDIEQAHQLDREVAVHTLPDGDVPGAIARLAQESRYDLVVVNVAAQQSEEEKPALDVHALLHVAPCRVFLSAPAALPQQPET